MAAAQRIPQQLIGGNEVTQPTLGALVTLFGNSLPHGVNTTTKDVKDWLQCPVGGNDCKPRAEALAKALRPVGIDTAPYVPALDNERVTKLPAQWDSVMKSLDANRPVIINGRDTFLGGDQSNFNTGKSHHVVLFLAYDTQGGANGPAFFVGFDPDVTATAETRQAWQAFGGPDQGPPTGLNAAQLNTFISNMVLTASGQELGPLFRKYYVNRSELFPTIPRFG